MRIRVNAERDRRFHRDQRHDDGSTKRTRTRQWYFELDTGPATDSGRMAFCAFDIQHGPQQRRPARLFQL